MISNQIEQTYFLKNEVNSSKIFKYILLTLLLSFFKVSAQKRDVYRTVIK